LESQSSQLQQHRDKNFVDVVCQINPKTGLTRTYVLSDNCTCTLDYYIKIIIIIIKIIKCIYICILYIYIHIHII